MFLIGALRHHPPSSGERIMTGVKPCPWQERWFHNHRIVCLDQQKRLAHSFAVTSSTGYHTFRTERAAMAFIRSL